MNYSEISNTLGLSSQTVKNYLWYLEKTFILQSVRPYFRNVRKEITKSPIVYFYDLGLRNYLLGFFGRLESPNYFGFILQNFIFHLLIERGSLSLAKVHFWRTLGQAEVDFVSVLGETMVPIEVKYVDFKKPIITRSLRRFIEAYQPKTALVITKKYFAEIEVNKTWVQFLPFWKLIEQEL